MADQSIKNLEDQQDEYDFKINTLKNRGEKNVFQTPFYWAELRLKVWFFLLQRTR